MAYIWNTNMALPSISKNNKVHDPKNLKVGTGAITFIIYTL
jgi:hypothetical protein